MVIRKSFIQCIVVVMCLILLPGKLSHAREIIDFTLQKAIDTALENSYQIKRLELGIERSRYYLKAREARLKSKVYLNLRSPDMRLLSGYKWNSTLQKDEIIRQNTLRWQSDLSINQPIILFGYPTNGYLSLNNTIYQYNQKISGSDDTNYYSRFFFRLDQPLFQANYLKNDFEQAKLDLEREELGYINNVTWLIDRTSYGYYNLFELSYRKLIYANYINNLEQVTEIVNNISNDDSLSIGKIQVQVELSNIRERLMQNQSDLRLDIARTKQNLRIEPEDSLIVKPEIDITSVNVDLDQAITYGLNLRPTLRLQNINKRRNEISLQETKSRGAFRINLSMTYGFEKHDQQYYGLLEENDNSYSVSIRAYIPIWDWGQRKANIQASKINIKVNELNIEENTTGIKSEITNAVGNLEEFKQRAFTMMENMQVSKELSAESLIQFQESTISVQDILKILERQRDTELSFLEAYLSYKRSIIRLMVNTHYDYENQIALIDKFKKGI
ncbi:TolC family protein [Candidatus Latescibacterota bacterium]